MSHLKQLFEKHHFCYFLLLFIYNTFLTACRFLTTFRNDQQQLTEYVQDNELTVTMQRTIKQSLFSTATITTTILLVLLTRPKYLAKGDHRSHMHKNPIWGKGGGTGSSVVPFELNRDNAFL